MSIVNPKECKEFALDWKHYYLNRGLNPADCYYLKRALEDLEGFAADWNIRAHEMYGKDNILACLEIVKKAMA